MSVRTRFAPSPTGVLHLGSIRTALFCWLYARHHGGRFILRIEDTDRERSSKENIDAILDGLQWLGLDADEGPFYQTERSDRYREVIDEWLETGKAYYCYCTREELDALRAEQMAKGERVRYDGRWRDRSEPREGVEPVVRFRNPVDGEVVVHDQVRGRVVFDNAVPSQHHVHTIVRAPNGGDYGLDLIRQHHERYDHTHVDHRPRK